MAQKKRAGAETPSPPDRGEIIEFLKSRDGAAVKRDLARAFGVKGADRAELRAILKNMEEDGALRLSSGGRIKLAGAMPPVAPIDIMSVDDDGGLIAEPASWDDDGDPPLIRIEPMRAAKKKPAPGVGDRVLARLTPSGDSAYEADIIRSIGRGAHRFLAVYRKSRAGGVAEPVERRAKGSFTIDKGDESDAKDGDLVWVETKNARGYGPKKARVRTIEGHIDDAHAFSTIALANHGVPTEMPAAAIREADKAKLPALGHRVDLRETPLVTIDPADAKDHDDAVYAEPDDDPENPGGHRVVVAIADVSYFVRAGGALDREALRRGNSVYLPDRVTPMLPERLSNDLCSLREGEERPCLAVEMVIDSGGNKKSHRFMRAMMRSAARLAYEDAQAISEGGRASPEIQEVVSHLYSAYRARLTERAKRSPLNLDLPERRVLLGKSGRVREIVRRDRFDAHRVIEEFMILANVAAAETLERARRELIYRVHDQPEEDDLEGVRDYLKTLGYSLAKGGAVRPSNFNQLLAIAEKRDEQEMVSQIVLRAQRQAVYDTENRGHFGLNLPRYAHFTSPIRRYADLTVHRALVAAGKLGEGGQTKDEAQKLSEIAGQISDFERRAVAAEREAVDRYLSDYLAGRVGSRFSARIRGVTKFGLFVMLDDSGADGFIPMRGIGPERYRFDEQAHAVIGETSGGRYRLGQAVTVELAEAIPLTGSLRFFMVSEPLAPNKRTTKRASGGASPAKKSRKKPSSKKRAPKNKSRKRSNAKPRRD